MQAEGFIDVQGKALEYRCIAGNSDKPVFVLLHEGLRCVHMWKDFPATLDELTESCVFVYSRQGYGRSASCELPR